MIAKYINPYNFSYSRFSNCLLPVSYFRVIIFSTTLVYFMIPSMLRRLSFEIFHQLLSEQSKLFHDSLLRLVDLGSLNTD